jgi:hypothetical protein
VKLGTAEARAQCLELSGAAGTDETVERKLGTADARAQCLELSRAAAASVATAVADEEEKLQQLVAHGCSLVRDQRII